MVGARFLVLAERRIDDAAISRTRDKCCSRSLRRVRVDSGYPGEGDVMFNSIRSGLEAHALTSDRQRYILLAV